MMNYKSNISSEEHFSIKTHEIMSQKIDTTFLESENLSQISLEKLNVGLYNSNDNVTLDQSTIMNFIDQINTDDECNTVFAIYTLNLRIAQSPRQFALFMQPCHLGLLIKYLKFNNTKKNILHILCYIVQVISNSPDLQPLQSALFESDFFPVLISNLADTEIETLIISISLTTYLLNLSEDARVALVTLGAFYTVQSLHTQDLNVNILRARLFSVALTKSYGEMTQEFYANTIQYILNLIFDEKYNFGNSTIIYFGLAGLNSAFQVFPAATTYLISNNSIFTLLDQYLEHRERYISQLTANILSCCLKNVEFPLTEFFKYDFVKKVFERFSWDDYDLLEICIQSLIDLINRPEIEGVDWIVREISSPVNIKNISPLNFKTKVSLVSMLNQLAQKANAVQIQSLLSCDIIFFLIDLLNTKQIDVTIDILSIFFNTTSKCSDKVFLARLINILGEYHVKDELASFVSDSEQYDEKQIFFIVTFVEKINQISQEIELLG